MKSRPGTGAVLVQRLEVFPGDEFAAVDSGLDRAQPPQHAHLLHGAHHGADVQPLQFGVDGVQPPDQVLQEQVEDLGQTDQLLSVHVKTGHFDSVHLHELTFTAQTRVGLRLGQTRRTRSQSRGS